MHNAVAGNNSVEVPRFGPVVVQRKIQQVCKEMERTGEWSVMVSPSETRGQWDLGVRGPFGRHFASFSDPEHIDQLPELVAQRFRAFS